MIKGRWYGDLDTRYVNGRDSMVLNRYNSFYFETNKGLRIAPKDGFITDFASIPRFFWRLLPPAGSGDKTAYGKAAVVHDWLYRDGEIYDVLSNTFLRKDRKFADEVFLAGMLEAEVNKVIAHTMYRMVRMFGVFSFKGGE